MRQFGLICKYGGAGGGLIMGIYAVVAAARDVQTWGLPSWQIYAIGLGIFTISSLFMILGFWRENKALRKPIEEQNFNDIKKVKIQQRQIYTDRKQNIGYFSKHGLLRGEQC